MSKPKRQPKRQPKNTRGPKPGQGGRPPGPKRVNLGTVRVLESTAAWLKQHGQTAAQALDSLSASNAPNHPVGEP